MAHVEQTQKMIPFITCEISFSQYVCELVLGVNVFDLDLGVLIDSNNQSRATLWVLETCLIVGLLTFMIILITASLSSKKYNKASLREECTFEETISTLSDHQSSQEFSFALETYTGLAVPVYSYSYFREEQQRSDPTSQAPVYRPSLILHPMK